MSTGRQCKYRAESAYLPTRIRAPAVVSELGYSVAPASVRVDERDMHMFQLFRLQIVPQMSGLFDNNFWHTSCLQASNVYPAIWHAALAVTSMYKRLQIKARTPAANQVRKADYHSGLRQCNESIKYLTLISQDGPTVAEQETMLLSCILLTGFFSLYGDPTTAIAHVNHGLKLIDEWQYWGQNMEKSLARRNGCVVPTVQLLTIFQRLETQSINSPFGTQSFRDSPSFQGYVAPVTPFVCPTDAFVQLFPILNGFLKLSLGRAPLWSSASPVSLLAARIQWGPKFEAWKKQFPALQQEVAFRSTFEGKDSFFEADVTRMIIMKVWEQLGLALFYADVSKGELCWDDFSPQYERIISLSETAFGRISEALHQKVEGKVEHYFSFMSTLGEPLQWVARSCRVPHIRRDALRLLKLHPHRDGIYDSDFGVLLTEAKIKVEEAGMTARAPGCSCRVNEFVCLDHRVVHISMLSDGNGFAEFNMKTVYDEAIGTVGTIITLPWTSKLI